MIMVNGEEAYPHHNSVLGEEAREAAAAVLDGELGVILLVGARL